MLVCEEHGGRVSDLVGYKQITVHLVFDIKLGEKLHRKPMYCTNFHKSGPHCQLACSIIISQDTVSIIIFTAALNIL